MAAASGYDANGNLISDGVRSFTYDAENRLTGVTGGTVPVTLAYDPWGRLSTVTASGATTIFANGGDQVLGELQQDPSGSGASASLRDYIYGPGGELLSWHAGAATNTALNWFHTDRIGSVIATSDPVGAITAYTYGPYGEPQSWAGSRFRYTGQMAIPEAQLYHYRARAYDPMMGRFLQTDPIRYGDGANIYAYTHGDPVNGTDPSGMVVDFSNTGRVQCNDGCFTGVDGFNESFAGFGGSAAFGSDGQFGYDAGLSAGDAAAVNVLIAAANDRDAAPNGLDTANASDVGVDAGGVIFAPAAASADTAVSEVVVTGVRTFATLGSSVLGGVMLSFIPTPTASNDTCPPGTCSSAVPSKPPPLPQPHPHFRTTGHTGTPNNNPPPDPPKDWWANFFSAVADALDKLGGGPPGFGPLP